VTEQAWRPGMQCVGRPRSPNRSESERAGQSIAFHGGEEHAVDGVAGEGVTTRQAPSRGLLQVSRRRMVLFFELVSRNRQSVRHTRHDFVKIRPVASCGALFH
jgi:hypothetical protein